MPEQGLSTEPLHSGDFDAAAPLLVERGTALLHAGLGVAEVERVGALPEQCGQASRHMVRTVDERVEVDNTLQWLVDDVAVSR